MLDQHSQPLSAPASGIYRVDPQKSRVRYTGKHMLGLGTVHATFSVREGELRIGDDGQTLSTKVTVDAASFLSGSSKRDRDVRSRGLLDVEQYPDITFASESIRRTPEGWLVPGTVTAHGHAVRIDVRVDRLTTDASELHVHGWARGLDRTAFGITGSRGLVGRHLDLEIEAVATLRSAPK
ncbi:YceI family protein [Nocardioides sp. GCM10028917]|jgi:polyisoprenoid-binding protein YceI|uniref:YceI family protein n=1 Tax=Nocardioides sp. GCM10028917 TaxID=3273408 RepID=UPI00361E7EA2